MFIEGILLGIGFAVGIAAMTGLGLLLWAMIGARNE